MATEAESEPLDIKLSHHDWRVDWTNELLNWITKYEMIEVGLTLVGTTAPCGDAPMR
jgi:hypothetical protein